jgi:small multidrug resistance pump
MAWLYLAVAIVFEVTATSFIGRTDGFSRPLPTAFVLAGYAVSFTLLARTVRSLEVGTAYAIWSAVGTAAIAVIGILVLRESVSVQKVVGLGFVICGVVILNLASGASHP